MKKEYFQVRFGFKVVSRLIEEEKVLKDDNGLYVEYYSENIFDTDRPLKERIYETEEAAKRMLIMEIKRKIIGCKMEIEKYESKLKELEC
jgi:hypothetical protein